MESKFESAGVGWLRIVFGILIIFILTASPSLAQKLPLSDGAYLRDTSRCAAYFKRDLDFIDFEVEQNGRSFSFPEVGCLVYSALNWG